MADYTVEIAGGNTLEQIQSAIQGEEAGGSEFLRSVVTPIDQRITNVATFKEWPPGTRPEPDIAMTKDGDPAPAGKAQIWSGPMIVSGTNTVVRVYR